MSDDSTTATTLPSVLSYPLKADIYTYRVPTPPRIVVPPPSLNSEAVPEISISARTDSPYPFLRSIDYTHLIQHNATLEWTYERRREAQPILPFLFLGPMTAAKDEHFLRRQRITLLLGVRQSHDSFRGESKLMHGARRVADRLGIEHAALDLSGPQDLIPSFPRAARLINSHCSAQQSPSVLVFCESGNERSAAVVAAYLMDSHDDVDHIKAMQLCQAQRFCVNFDDASKRLLLAYWEILVARRTVAAAAAASPSSVAAATAPSRTFKRALEREDNAMDLDADEAEDDRERFGGRGFAPFL